MSIFSFAARTERIFQNEDAREHFTISEIADAMVNLAQAKKNLSREEYFYIMVLFRIFKDMNKTHYLTKKGFLALSYDIVAHFDLIAPYYIFCGSKDTLLGLFESAAKHSYRTQARELLKAHKLYGKDWMALQKSFAHKFYP